MNSKKERREIRLKKVYGRVKREGTVEHGRIKKAS